MARNRRGTAKLFEFLRLLQFREIREKDKRGENRDKLVTKFYRIPLRLSCIPIVTVMTTPLGMNIKWKKIYNQMDINAKGNLQGVTLQVLMMRGRVAFPSRGRDGVPRSTAAALGSVKKIFHLIKDRISSWTRLNTCSPLRVAISEGRRPQPPKNGPQATSRHVSARGKAPSGMLFVPGHVSLSDVISGNDA